MTTWLERYDFLLIVASFHSSYANDCLQIYDFLVVFPPQERVLALVKSPDKTEQDVLPMEKPYIFLYSMKALSTLLREAESKVRVNALFIFW